MLAISCTENVVPEAIGHAEINVLEFVMDLMVRIQFPDPRSMKTEMVMNMMKRAVDQVTGYHARPERHEIARL